MGGHIACTGEKIMPHGVLVRRPEGKRPLRRARNVWEDNNKNGCSKDGMERCEIDPPGSGNE